MGTNSVKEKRPNNLKDDMIFQAVFVKKKLTKNNSHFPLIIQSKQSRLLIPPHISR